MAEEKKPDNVVFNTDTNRYDAALKPYATSVGAPVITSTDTTAWKNRSINKTNHKLNAKYLELKAEYEKMTKSLSITILFSIRILVLNLLLAKFIIFIKGKMEKIFFHSLRPINVILITLAAFI
tara:strand:+ start:1623 stop:1994 length:372 start_codon:yes stop_codon:yes gene_type:complete